MGPPAVGSLVDPTSYLRGNTSGASSAQDTSVFFRDVSVHVGNVSEGFVAIGAPMGAGSVKVKIRFGGERGSALSSVPLYNIYLLTTNPCHPPIDKAPMVPQINPDLGLPFVEIEGFPQKTKTKLTKNANKSLQKQIQSSFSDAPICTEGVIPEEKQSPHHNGSSLPGSPLRTFIPIYRQNVKTKYK